ncbi:hypothetical protein [Vulcanisaeta souniana]|uniref:hypothetical protein n=1 Tax=Vulcanisaeta souniana TaxID=164452 RepID=UPI001FB32892|nr:hypothetical protein [Vulcanisaeta souniana]
MRRPSNTWSNWAYYRSSGGSLKGKVTSSVKPWLKVKQHNPERRGRGGIYYELTKVGKKVASEVWKNYVRPNLRKLRGE